MRTCEFTILADPNLNPSVFSAPLSRLIRCHGHVGAKITDVFGWNDHANGSQTRGDNLCSYPGNILSAYASFSFIGESQQQNVISGSVLLRKESPQSKHVHASQIIELAVRICSRIDLFAGKMEAQTDS